MGGMDRDFGNSDMPMNRGFGDSFGGMSKSSSCCGAAQDELLSSWTVYGCTTDVLQSNPSFPQIAFSPSGGSFGGGMGIGGMGSMGTGLGTHLSYITHDYQSF